MKYEWEMYCKSSACTEAIGEEDSLEAAKLAAEEAYFKAYGFDSYPIRVSLSVNSIGDDSESWVKYSGQDWQRRTY